MQSKFSVGSLVVYEDAIHEVIEVLQQDIAVAYKLLTLAFLSDENRTVVLMYQTASYQGRDISQPFIVAEVKLTACSSSKPKFAFNEWVKFGDGVRVLPGVVRFIKYENNNYWYDLIDADPPERFDENLRNGYSVHGYGHMQGGLADERFISK